MKLLDEAHSQQELAWRRIRRALEGLPVSMLEFIDETYGSVAVPEAWEEFFQGEPPTFDPESPHFGVFCSWWHFRWTPDFPESDVIDKSLIDTAPALALLQRKGHRVDPVLQSYLRSALQAPLSFYEVVSVSPGQGLRLREFFTQRESAVIEHSASQSLRTGELVFGSLVACEGVIVIEAMGGVALPPAVKQALIDFAEEVRVTPRTTLERLADYDLELIALYLDAAADLLEPALPKLNNTDGEALEMQTLIYDIHSADEAFSALGDLDFNESEAEQRKMCTLTGSGAIRKPGLPGLNGATSCIRRGTTPYSAGS